MVSKPERGRYLTLEDVRVSYKHKDDTIHLTSADPDIPNGSFYITLNRDTSTEEALRELLIEHGYIKENDVVSKLEETQLDSIYSYRPRNPLQDLLVDSLVGRGEVNFPRYVHISGQPGCGKTDLALRMVEDASAMGIKTYVVSTDAEEYQEKIQGSSQLIKLQDLPDGALNPFSLGLQAGGILKLLVAFAQLTDETTAPDSLYHRLLWTRGLSEALGAVEKIEDPTLDMLLTIVRASKNREFDSYVGNKLEQLQKSEFGRLLFGKSNYMGEITENQNTIFDIGDLAHTSDEILPDNYTVEQRASVFIKKLVIKLLNKKITTSNRPTLFVVEESPEFVEEITRTIRSKNCTLVSVSKEPINKYTSSLSSTSYHYLSSIAHEMIGSSTDSDIQDAVDLPLGKLNIGEFFWYDINTGDTEFYKSH
jgi:hypothetical protein